MSEGFRFDQNLARAETLPSSWYVDPAALERERERLRPHLAARRPAAEPRTAGRLLPPRSRASRSCRRAARTARCAPSRTSAATAPARSPAAGARPAFAAAITAGPTASTAGSSARPEFDGVVDFDRAAVRLPEFRVETLGPLVFVNLDPAAPPLERGPRRDRGRDRAASASSALRFAARQDYDVDCNWKVYVDNYLEGYHIPIVHPSPLPRARLRRYRVETRAHYSRQHAPVRRGRRRSLYRRHSSRQGPEALYYWLFPNLMLNVYPDNVQVNVVVPLGPERTLVRFEWLVPDLRPDAAGSPAIVRVLGRGAAGGRRHLRVRSARPALPLLRPGALSVKRENGVHHFHGLLAAALRS